MIPEFLEFCCQIFSSIEPYTAEEAKRALTQYEMARKEYPLTEADTCDDLRQGDIYSWLPFVVHNDEGKLELYNLKAMLLTNTCDATRNDYLEFAAIWPIGEFFPEESKSRDVKNNKNYRFFYIPDPRTKNDVVDFGLLTSIPRTLFDRFISQGKSCKEASLSWVGYYMFLTKLTVFFMRREDVEVNDSRR